MPHIDWLNYSLFLRTGKESPSRHDPPEEDLELAIEKAFAPPRLAGAARATSQICEACRTIFTGRLLLRNLETESKAPESASRAPVSYQTLQQTWEEIIQAEDLGCSLCYLTLRSLKLRELRLLKDCKYIRYSVSGRHPKDPLALHLDYYLPAQESTPEKLLVSKKYSLTRTPDTLRASAGLKYEADMSSSMTLKLAEVWLENCLTHHSKCRLSNNGHLSAVRELPTRLVYIDEQGPRLCYGKHLNVNTRYLTLSHRWETTPAFTLTKENEADLLTEIDINKLNKTWRNAMYVCLSWGYKYIWIDSLCISQNNNEWEFESGRMANVYANSECNLMAADARNEMGLFSRRRHPASIGPCRVEAHWDGYEPTIYVCKSDYNDEDTVNSRLLRRSWVLQEMLLSPRILFFGNDMIHWECRERKYCETFPIGLRGNHSKLGVHSDAEMMHMTGYRDNTLQHLAKWREVLQKYTKTSLTFPEKDKLIAISGVARCLGQSTDYLGGIWRSNLARQLLWYSELGVNERHADYNAPSWSWASIKGPIAFPLPPLDDISPTYIVDIIHATTTPILPDNVYGPVKDAFIRLQGHLCLAKIAESRTSKHRLLIGQSEGRVICDTRSYKLGDTFIFLPIEEEVVDGETKAIFGIMLKPSGTGRNGEFERDGFFEIYMADNEGPSIHEFRQLMKQEIPSVACDIVRTRDDGCRIYDITLI